MAGIKSASDAAEAHSMLTQLPKHLPELAEILANLGNPGLDKLSTALGVSTKTVKRYIEHGAPRPVLLSLWSLTSWGHHSLDAELFNAAQLAQLKAAALERRVIQLERQIAKLCRIGQFAAANDPTAEAALPTPEEQHQKGLRQAMTVQGVAPPLSSLRSHSRPPRRRGFAPSPRKRAPAPPLRS